MTLIQRSLSVRSTTSTDSSVSNITTLTYEDPNSPLLFNSSRASSMRSVNGLSIKSLENPTGPPLNCLEGETTLVDVIHNIVTAKYRKEIEAHQQRRFVPALKKLRRMKDLKWIMNEKQSRACYLKANIKFEEKMDGLSDFHDLKPLSKASSQASVLTSSDVSSTVESSISTPAADTEEPSSTNFDSRIEQRQLLISQATFQKQVISQLTRALELRNDGINSSPEHLEAKKFILIANHKYHCCLKKLTQDDSAQAKLSVRASGILELYNFVFSTKLQVLTEHQHFLLIIQSGTEVVASELVSPDEQGCVRIPNNANLKNLGLNCKLKVKLYHLGVKSAQEEVSSGWVSKFKKFLRKQRLIPEPPRDPRFILWADCEIEVSDLKHPNIPNKEFELKKYYRTADLSSTFSFDFFKSVTFNGRQTGFLTIASEINTLLYWNRYWCRLDGHLFTYYKYETDCIPAGCIDLRCCMSARIEPAKREFCSRRQTLQILTGCKVRDRDEFSMLVMKAEDYAVTINFLVADSLAEMEVWQTNFNVVLSALQYWNEMMVDLSIFK